MRWAGWHVGELVAVGAPGVAAVVWSPWWALLAVPAALGWWRHERAPAHPGARVRERAGRAA